MKQYYLASKIQVTNIISSMHIVENDMHSSNNICYYTNSKIVHNVVGRLRRMLSFNIEVDRE